MMTDLMAASPTSALAKEHRAMTLAI